MRSCPLMHPGSWEHGSSLDIVVGCQRVLLKPTLQRADWYTISGVGACWPRDATLQAGGHQAGCRVQGAGYMAGGHQAGALAVERLLFSLRVEQGVDWTGRLGWAWLGLAGLGLAWLGSAWLGLAWLGLT